MEEWEPVSDILKNAHSEANNIIKTAKTNAETILKKARSEAEDSLKALTQDIQSKVESKFSAEYSRKKISYNKKIQDAMSIKLKKIRSEAIIDLVSDKAYPAIITSVLDSVISNYKNAEVHASTDFDILSKKYTVTKDERPYHGFFIDFGNKIDDYSIEYIFDKYLSDNPVKLI